MKFVPPENIPDIRCNDFRTLVKHGSQTFHIRQSLDIERISRCRTCLVLECCKLQRQAEQITFSVEFIIFRNHCGILEIEYLNRNSVRICVFIVERKTCQGT